MRGYTSIDMAKASARCAVLLGCTATLVLAATTVAVPYQLNYGEGPLLGMGLRLARGGTLYPAASEPPYIINPYGPVPYYLVGAVVKIFGLSLTAPRLLIAVMTVCSAILIGAVVRHCTGSLAAASIFGALFLTLPNVQRWVVILRVDMIGVALSLAGIYLFVRSDRWHWAAPFFIAALFTKWTFIAAPGACFLSLLVEGSKRKALHFAAVCGSAAALAFALLQWQSGGWFAFHTIEASTAHRFFLDEAVRYVPLELCVNLPLIALTAFAVQFSKPKPQSRPMLLSLLYFGITFPIMFAMGKAGGDRNYFLEWDAALCVLAGVTYGFATRKLQDVRWVQVILPLMVVIVAVSNVAIGDVYQFLHPDDYAEVLGCRDAYQFIAKRGGDHVLTENIGAAVLAGKFPVVFEPFLWEQEVARAGWSDSEIVNLIRTRKLSVILLGAAPNYTAHYAIFDRWPPNLLKAIDQNYKFSAGFDCTDAFFAFEPKIDP